MLDIVNLARQEIYETYGHVTTAGRKTLRKYGRNPLVPTSEVDLTHFNEDIVYNQANDVTHFSSDDAGDTSVNIYIEGMTYSGGVLTFVTQTVTTDASNGRTKTALTTPLVAATRVRGVTDGTVYVYRDVSVTNGVPASDIANTLVATDRTSLSANTAVAGNNYFVLIKCWATLGRASGNAAADIRFKIQHINDSVTASNYFTNEVTSISLSNGMDQTFEPYEIVEPNSYCGITAISSSGTLDIKGGFQGFFLDIVNQ